MDKVGISYLSRNSNTVGNTEELGTLNDKMVTARVVDISLNSNSQLFNSTGQWGWNRNYPISTSINTYLTNSFKPIFI